jgi:hypothetical protein
MKHGMNDANLNAITPYPLAMVVCDWIYRDPYTGKQTLIGTFSAIGGPSFPLVHPQLAVYVSLTDGRGRMSVRLRLVDVDEVREPILEFDDDVEFTDPRMIVELAWAAGGVEFPEPGEYRLQLHANDEFILERRILAVGPTRVEEPRA